MKKKRMKSVSLAAVIGVVLLSGCVQNQNQGQKTEKVSCYDRGLEVISQMDHMAESEDYIKMMSSSPEVLEVVKTIGSKDYSSPKAVYQVTITGEIDDILGGLYGDLDEVKNLNLSAELKENLKSRILTSIPTMISAADGSTSLAAVSLINGEAFFIDPDLTEDQLYLYIYEGGCSAAVTFSVHEEGIVSATGRFMVGEAAEQALSQEEISQWIMKNAGIMGLSVTKVEP